jgi:PKD repeat protein
MIKKVILLILIFGLIFVLPVSGITRTNTTSAGFVTSVFAGAGSMTFKTPVNSTVNGTKVFTDMFFVGGGGGGGSSIQYSSAWKSGAGGGGGGLNFAHDYLLDENTTYTIYVGAGAIGQNWAQNGNDSYVYPVSIVGKGGGAGGWTSSGAAGVQGGSGGASGWGGAAGANYSGQGWSGGIGDAAGYGTGGGGGNGGIGGNGARYNSGNGGACGYANSTIISHFPMASDCYSAGGGGGGLPLWSTVAGTGGAGAGDGSYGIPGISGKNATSIGGGGGGTGYNASIVIGGSGFEGIAMIRYFDENAPPDTPVCNFTAIPQSGPQPLTVVLSDLSSNNATSWNWHLYRPGTGHYISTAKNWTAGPLEAGSWTVDLNATNAGGSCHLHMPGYITVSEGAGYVVVNLDIKNAITGALIQDSPVGIRNVTNGVWRNSTCATGLIYFDSTGVAWEYPLALGETITLAASPTGYTPAWHDLTIPYSDYRDYLYLLPSSIIPGAGKGIVIVNVISNRNGVSVSGASVVLDTGQMGSTNTAGAITFLNVSAGSRTVTVSTPDFGYETTSKTFDLASAETKFITIQLILTGETPVPTFQPISTTTITVDLNKSGASFLENWAKMAIGFGGFIFIMVFLYFVKKALK